MKKILFAAVAALFVSTGINAQENYKYSPSKGDFSIGVTFNPIALGQNKYMPEVNAFAGEYVNGLGNTPKQMFILSTDPLASFMIKYRMSEKVALRANLGITGSIINYKEYVRDDKSFDIDPGTPNKATDRATSKLNGTTVGIALEFTKAFGKLAFIGGIGLQYAMGGGSLAFDYGNDYGDYNAHNPSCMPYMMVGDKTLNQWNDVKAFFNAEFGPSESNWKYVNGRPLRRYNVGMNHGIGLVADMGLEYYFAGRMSISAAVTFVPFMFVFQPETYTDYEAWNIDASDPIELKKYVSPGSTALLYGTQNLGLRLAFNYYL